MSDKARPRSRTIRSFVQRSGRMTPAQKRAFGEHWPRWGLEPSAGPLNPQAAFGNDHPLILEIGFGMGQSLAEMASAAPHTNFLGVEVHRPGVGRLLHLLAAGDIENVRIYRADAVEVLRDCITPGSLDGAQIFFPDPWPKKRHHKRRLIQPDFVALLTDRLKPGGTLHLATDWQNYAEQMLEVLSAEPQLVNTAQDDAPTHTPNSTSNNATSATPDGSPNGAPKSIPGSTTGYSLRPPQRPLTKFETRGQRLGHGIWDLVFRRK